MNKDLKEKYELQALFDLSKALNSSLDLKNILDTILLTPMGKLLISKGVVFIAKDRYQFVIEALKGLPRSLLGAVIQIEEFPAAPTFINDLKPSAWKAFFVKNEINLVIPILHDRKELGIICFGNKIVQKKFTDSDLDYLHSLSNIAATAVQNAIIFDELNEANRKLEKKLQEQNTLSEIVRELNSTLSSLKSEKVINLLVYSIMGEMMVNKCLIFLSENTQMRLSLNRGYTAENIKELCKRNDILEKLFELKTSIIFSENEQGEVYDALYEAGIRVLVPMQVENKTKGVIALGEKITKFPFVKDDLDFLAILGNWSMISIETARLIEQEIEKQKMEEELRIASGIQKQLLPKKCPELEDYEVAATNIPSLHVGGDYFDCIRLNENNCLFCIADVSGKGVPAALLMSNLQASLHALVNTGLELNEIADKINNIIYHNTAYDKFITFFVGILFLKEKTFLSVNAGHNPPYLFHKDKTFQTLMEGGLILGMMPGVKFKSEKVQLKPGDCIVMFTDGVSEAINKNGEEFQEHRIEKCIIDNFNLSSEEILQSLINSVKEFSKGCPQADDITAMVIKIK